MNAEIKGLIKVSERIAQLSKGLEVCTNPSLRFSMLASVAMLIELQNKLFKQITL